MPNIVEVAVRAPQDGAGGAGGAGGGGMREPVERAKGHATRLRSRFASVGASAVGMFSGALIARAASVLVDVVGTSTHDASNLSESVNAVRQVFGDNAATVLRWGQDNANRFGLSRRAFNEAVTPLGAMLHNAGMTMADSASSSVDLTKRAADMAAVFHSTVPEALEAISAGIRGETDPLERYGVSLSAARVQAEALAETHKTNAGQLTDTERATARVNLIMKQTASTSGSFEASTHRTSGAAQVYQAKLEDLRAKIGSLMLPAQMLLLQGQAALATAVADRVLPAINAVTKIFSTSEGKGALAIVASVAAGAMVRWAVLSFTAWAGEMSATAVATLAATWPVLAVIAAVAALAALFIYLYNHNETFRRGVIITVAAAKAGFQLLMQTFQEVVSWVREHWATISTILMVPVRIAATYITVQWKIIQTTLQVVVGWVREHWATISTILMAPARIAVTYITVQWKIIHTTLQAVIRVVLFLFRDLPNNIRSALGNLGNLLSGAGGELPSGLMAGARAVLNKLGRWAADIKDAVVNKIKSVFGIHSPSRRLADLASRLVSSSLAGRIDLGETGLENVGGILAERIKDRVSGLAHTAAENARPERIGLSPRGSAFTAPPVSALRRSSAMPEHTVPTFGADGWGVHKPVSPGVGRSRRVTVDHSLDSELAALIAEATEAGLPVHDDLAPSSRSAPVHGPPARPALPGRGHSDHPQVGDGSSGLEQFVADILRLSVGPNPAQRRRK
jgi:hypothetical protein